MILLDTNIISEMMKLTPDTQVIAWLDAQKSIYLFVSTITVAEISYGIDALPKGKRRQQLEDAFNKVINISFKHRVLSFDISAAYSYGKLMANRKAIGRPLSVPDAQIAAIADAQNFTLANRNHRDFVDCNFAVVNPFE